MDYFNRREGRLYAEDVPLSSIAAEYSTPCYVYSRATFERHYRVYEEALADFPHLICYAVKANSNLAVLNVLARLGAGFDIVSIGELERVLAAGGRPSRIVFSGVGKQVHEMERALSEGIHCFNVESQAELERLAQVAGRMGKRAPVSLRVNPDVDAKTHPYISTGLKENKFGIERERALELYQWAAQQPSLDVIGIDCHIGSQLTDLAPFMDALDRLLELIDELAQRGVVIKHLDLGGGLGVRYDKEQPPEPKAFAEAVLPKLAGRDLRLALEPGRSIAANAGVLLTRVEYLKPTAGKQFALVDAAMNDLLRPSLYGAWQAIERVEPEQGGETEAVYDLVGPVCETGDFLGKERQLALQAGDLLAVKSAGAYGFVMASNYNSRGRPAEVMVDGEDVHLIGERETIPQLFAREHMLPDE